MSEHVLKNYDKYLFKNYLPYPIVFESGEGCYLYDSEGKKYLDFLGGIAVNSLGHCHPTVVKAVTRQLKKLISVSNYFITQPPVNLARELLKGTHLKRVFLCNSGTEAMEAALKLAKKYQNDKGKSAHKFVAFDNSFHGRTIGALCATGQDKYKTPFTPLPDWFTHVPFMDITALENAFMSKDVCGLVMECIQGEGGVITPSSEYMTQVAELIKSHKKLLIIDEVQTGIGRTGSFFAYTKYGLKPDIVITAKGLASGLPIGAVLATEKLAQTFTPGDHGTTFGANPLCSAAALAVLKVVKNKNFMSEVALKGGYLKKKLAELQSQFPEIIDIRGEGLIIGAEIDSKIDTKEISKKCLARGLILIAAGKNTLRFVPPLIVTYPQIDEAIEILKHVLQE